MFKEENRSVLAFLLTLFVLVSYSTPATAQDGEALFNSKCATCHTPHKDMTGPKLFEVRQKWADGGAKEGSLHLWVRNWQKAVAEDSYAKTVSEWSPTAMNTFPSMTDEEIDAIFDYVDAQPAAGAAASSGGASAGGGTDTLKTDSDKGLGAIWYLVGGFFLILIFSLGGIKRQLKNVDKENESNPKIGSKQWAWENKKYIGIVGFVAVIGAVVWLFLGLYGIGVVSGYQPSQPIPFPHDIHAGINGIDCKYCHNSANKSRTAGIPTTNVCMNCHKQIQGEGEQVEKIKKIYQSAGFSPDGGGVYGGERENLIWNKVHVLPDYVFFSHEQHVEVGGVDCKQCHGDMTKQHETARIVPVEELNQIEGNIQLTKATLTMGWCIECHDKKEVSTGTLDTRGGYYEEIHKRLLENDPSLYEQYLADGKVTARELGGWECAKCHY